MCNYILAKMQARLLNTMMLKELDSINKSMSITSKTLQSEINCFRHRFSKHEPGVSPTGSEAIDVRMYETHNPGFCFHRNGQYRKQSLKMESSSYMFIMSIYPYIFTDGEIDPDKVICLHLLTVHSLEIPCTPKSKRMISHTIAKSIPEYEKPDYPSSLPLYWLESHYVEKKVKNIQKEKIKHVKLVNRNIELLVGMIMTILNDINLPKYSKIINLACSREEVIKMLSQPKTKKMFQLFEKSPVLTSLKNYALTSQTHNESLHLCGCNDKEIKKIVIPLKCTEVEYFTDQIRMKLLRGMRLQCQKSDLGQTIINNENRKHKDFETISFDKFIRKIEFSEKSSISERKTDARLKNTNTLQNLNHFSPDMIRSIAKCKLNSSSEGDEVYIPDLLRNMSNSQRIMIGEKVAQLKEKEIMKGNINKKVSVVNIMQQVLSKNSFENLLSSSFNEADKIFIQPFKNVPLWSLTDMNDEDVKLSIQNHLTQKYSLPSDHLMENRSTILFATIRQDVISKETDKKILRFLSK